MDFNELYKKYRIKLFKFTYNYTKNYDEQEELVQDIFYNIYISLKNFKNKSSLDTYIYAIARNTCIKFIKNKDKERKKFRELVKFFDEKLEKTSYETFILSEDMKYFLYILDKLDNDFKEIFYLSEIEQLKYKEISKILNVPIGTVKSRLNRAKEKILKFLDLDIETKGGFFNEKRTDKKL